MTLPFVGFPKMPRLSREIVVTEKIDGTNAQVNIEELNLAEDPSAWDRAKADPNVIEFFTGDGPLLYAMRAGSRTRWIRPGDDNFAFALWVKENAQELFKLGKGAHFGEWYGKGIQAGYGLDHRRFALFNTHRWGDASVRPSCCETVPVMYQGVFDEEIIQECLWRLESEGSRAAPGFMKPEGVIIYHVAAGIGFKKTIHKDEVPKALAA